ncbi:SDR family NAD(P)-dependent oxidoreductase [Dictyobacter aurantiacus]|uniref:Short-chain dehydrogenase n=1 Tax=Dictyobacter aurantiacus TaxID=1936993 RepID=A0A401ZT04_9CHLR|nr:SDR family oxidoreductase [Dictyobacter aurantiacus]GCE09997.1 short-chain dehydrogenase [Dictyobacter aurantiacus]
MDIQDKVVVITGASGGIGLATAHLFAEAGAKVALAARSADTLTTIVNELHTHHHEALAVPTDMCNKDAVEALMDRVFEQYGRIDILINNAGQAVRGNVADVDIDQFRQIFELNVLGPVEAMQAIIPKMRQNGGGLIINVSSIVSHMHLPSIGAYAATKAALNMISDTAREELTSENIRITTMFPNATATNFGKNSLATPKTNQQGPRPPQGGPEPDSAEAVAQKILEAARNEPHEQYMDRSV